MDAKACGSFIAELRKEKNLTQRELGNSLGVSDKAISRWETGKGYPDVASLVDLSEFFEVSVNEILAGKRVEKENISALADRNIIEAMEHQVSGRKAQKLSTAIVIIVFAVLMFPAFRELFKGFRVLFFTPEPEVLQSFTGSSIVSLLLLVCGFAVYKGNIGLIHSYHYKNVTDKEGYTKAMGKIIMIMPVFVFAGQAINLFSDAHPTIEYIGSSVTLFGVTVCMILLFKVQIKYNGGIF